MKPTLCAAAILTFAFASPALAYIDPVTGSFILQALIGGFAAALVAIRRVREKILGFFGIRKSGETSSSSAEDTDKT